MIAGDDKGHSGRGTYLLLARLDRATELTIGRLGAFHFFAGWYAYAGSALGPGGLRARLGRHRRSDKRLHWHIDYLLAAAHSTLEASWQLESSARLECAWAAAARELFGAQVIVPRFGASDCQCAAHLVYFPRQPAVREIECTLCKVSPENLDIQHNVYVPSTGR